MTSQQVEQLAVAHDRSFPFPSEPTTIPPDAATEIQACDAASTALPISQVDASLSQKLSLLETRIAQLSEQVAHLTLALLQERERTAERRLSDLETVVQELAGTPRLAPASPPRLQQQATVERVALLSPARPLIEAEQRARSRMPPLIEYSALGTYVIVSAQEGELSLLPDSREWFDWLATLSSFRFIGPCGRFTAYRDRERGKPTRGWVAHRCIHNRHFKHWLAVTDQLTIDRLEQMAAKLQMRVDAL